MAPVSSSAFAPGARCSCSYVRKSKWRTVPAAQETSASMNGMESRYKPGGTCGPVLTQPSEWCSLDVFGSPTETARVGEQRPRNFHDEGRIADEPLEILREGGIPEPCLLASGRGAVEDRVHRDADRVWSRGRPRRDIGRGQQVIGVRREGHRLRRL